MKAFWVIGLPLISVATLCAQINSYTQSNLTSDIPNLAAVTDASLVNPWGLSRPANPANKEDRWWASDQVTGVTTLYDANGAIVPLTVTIPPASGTGTGSPTGTAIIGATFVFATLDGTISEWVSSLGNAQPANNGFVHPSAGACTLCHVTNASIKVNHATQNASYSGITVATNGTAQDIYVANSNGGIEVYDANFIPVTLPAGAFVDAKIPAGFTPANVQAIGKRVYVTYNAANNGGSGFVVAYNSMGTRILTLQPGAWFNQPWGVAQAPANFGHFSNALLVGNTGSGEIAAFNPSTGAFLGMLENTSGQPIANPGLWAISFGTGSVDAGPTNVLYFNAGIQNYTHGLFGAIASNN